MKNMPIVFFRIKTGVQLHKSFGFNLILQLVCFPIQVFEIKQNPSISKLYYHKIQKQYIENNASRGETYKVFRHF